MHLIRLRAFFAGLLRTGPVARARVSAPVMPLPCACSTVSMRSSTSRPLVWRVPVWQCFKHPFNRLPTRTLIVRMIRTSNIPFLHSR